MQIQYTKNLNPGRFELGTTLVSRLSLVLTNDTNHSRHQSHGSTQGSGKLCVAEHAPYGSYSKKLAI